MMKKKETEGKWLIMKMRKKWPIENWMNDNEKKASRCNENENEKMKRKVMMKRRNE